MAAKIIQTDSTPFKAVQLDSITLDIIENALRNARTEMDPCSFARPCHPAYASSTMPFP